MTSSTQLLIATARDMGHELAEAYAAELSDTTPLPPDRESLLLDAVTASLSADVERELGSTAKTLDQHTVLLKVAGVRAFYQRLAELRTQPKPVVGE